MAWKAAQLPCAVCLLASRNKLEYLSDDPDFENTHLSHVKSYLMAHATWMYFFFKALMQYSGESRIFI